jgi:hypothetical protein
MTRTDLRIKFKSETGFAPTITMDDIKEMELTPEYIKWLENNSTKRKREQYHEETGKYATNVHDNEDYIFEEYSIWLEEKYCERYTILEQITWV